MKYIVATLLGAVASLFVFAAVAGAAGFKGGDQISVAAGETVDGSFYGAGTDITIAGTVEGDVICAGQTVTISGVIDGDVVCAAQTIRIAGTVRGDVRLAAQTVTLESQIGQNATVFTQTLYTHENNKIGGDLGGGVQTADLAGQIGRDVTLGGQTVKLSGTIGRDADLTAENVTLTSSAVVGGGLSYVSGREASVAEGARVTGETKRSEPVQNEQDRASAYGFAAGIAWYLFFASLMVGLAVILLFPRKVHDISSDALKRPGRTALVGLATGILVPLLIMATLLTLVGVPLGLFIGLLWLVVMIISGPLFAYLIGRLLLRKYATQPVLTMLVGTIAVAILYMVPIINMLTVLASLIIGIGMLLTELAKHYKKPVYSVKA